MHRKMEDKIRIGHWRIKKRTHQTIEDNKNLLNKWIKHLQSLIPNGFHIKLN